MKKLLLVSFLACFTVLLSSAAIAYEDDMAATGEGSSAGISVGWMHSSFKDTGTDSDFNMWKIGGSFKHQVPDELYGRASIFYAGSGTEKKSFYAVGTVQKEDFLDGLDSTLDLEQLSQEMQDKFNGLPSELTAEAGADIKTRLRMWAFQVAIGWTFAFAEAGMISPFLALAYNSMKLKNTMLAKVSADTTTYEMDLVGKLTFYGFLIKLGLDLHYMFTNNFSAGIIAAVGLPISNKLKANGDVKLSQKVGEGDPEVLSGSGSEKVKLKNNIMFELIVPVKYYIEDWTLGLEGSYSYRKFKLKDSDGNEGMKRHNFGVALTAGLIF